jgi:hypothetical protein
MHYIEEITHEMDGDISYSNVKIKPELSSAMISSLMLCELSNPTLI